MTLAQVRSRAGVRESAARGLAAAESGNLSIPSLCRSARRGEERRARLYGGRRLEDSPAQRWRKLEAPLPLADRRAAPRIGRSCVNHKPLDRVDRAAYLERHALSGGDGTAV